MPLKPAEYEVFGQKCVARAFTFIVRNTTQNKIRSTQNQ